MPILKLPELDSSAHLSSSFRNLYHSVFNSSFGSSGLQASQSGGFPFSSEHQSIASTDPMSLSQSGHMLNASHPGPMDSQQMDWLKQSMLVAGVSPADAAVCVPHQPHPHQMHSPHAPPPVEQQPYTFHAPLLPTQTPQEMLQSLDMHQFRGKLPLSTINHDEHTFAAMMGNMQTRDVQEWLAECKDDLAVSWRDFLRCSINVNGAVPPPSSCQQQLPSIQQIHQGHQQQHQVYHHQLPVGGIKIEQPSRSPMDEATINMHNAPTPAALDGSSPTTHVDGEEMDTSPADNFVAMPHHQGMSEGPRGRATTVSVCGPGGMGQRNPVLGSVRRLSTDLLTSGPQVSFLSFILLIEFEKL